MKPSRSTSARSRYHDDGFRIYDVSNPTNPRLVCYHKTHGFGVHRFDVDENYAYISTEMAGYIGDIRVISDIRNGLIYLLDRDAGFDILEHTP